MQLFTAYIQPATHWLQLNPEWALFITFLVSFAESLAIVGSIVPGSITMTGIGILAGSGIMRVDFTLLAATAGAIVGDGISYIIGAVYSDRLVTIWPFNRYPHWLNYGKEYFARHGGKSVLIGRFFGPLRSIIPVIAGMMHMSHWRFYLANIISAFFWSLLYILPGVLLGAASTELPPDTAAQLIIMVLAILVGIWLTTVVIRWSLIRLNQFLSATLDRVWRRATEHPKFQFFFKAITPSHEKNHYPSAGIFILLSFFLTLFVIVLSLVIGQSHLKRINNPIHYAMQSIRNETIDTLAIAMTQIASPITLMALSGLLLGLVLYKRQMRLFCYELSLAISTIVSVFVMHLLIFNPRPSGILIVQSSSSFPSDGLTYATVLFSSFLLYLNQSIHLKFKSVINISLILILLLLGCSQLLLGDYWATDMLAAYLLGLLITLTHYLFYRKKLVTDTATHTVLFVSFMTLLILSSSTSFWLYYTKSYKQHRPFITQYTIKQALWWNQTKPLLPIYRRNRFGHPVSLFNIQYAGSLEHFSSTLEDAGWSLHEESFMQSLLQHLSGNLNRANHFLANSEQKIRGEKQADLQQQTGNPSSNKPKTKREGYDRYPEYPLMAQLYLNQKPSLVMNYPLKKNGPSLILRLWRSNYYFQDKPQNIWIGSVHTHAPLNRRDHLVINAMSPLLYVQKALTNDFAARSIPLSIKQNKKLQLKRIPILLLIREEETGNE